MEKKKTINVCSKKLKKIALFFGATLLTGIISVYVAPIVGVVIAGISSLALVVCGVVHGVNSYKKGNDVFVEYYYVLQKAIRFVANDTHVEPVCHVVVELIAESRCGGEHELVVFGKGFGGFCHSAEIVAHLLFAAAGQQCYDGKPRKVLVARSVFAEGVT